MVVGRRCRGGEEDECANEKWGGVDMGSGEHGVHVDGRGGGGRDGCGREEHVWMQPHGQVPRALFMMAGWGLSNQASWVVRRGSAIGREACIHAIQDQGVGRHGRRKKKGNKRKMWVVWIYGFVSGS
jgi:hypothetical protein